MKNYIKKFFNLFAKKKVEPPKPETLDILKKEFTSKEGLVPCSLIDCVECVYFDSVKCAITETDVQDLQKRFTALDVNRFKKR